MLWILKQSDARKLVDRKLDRRLKKISHGLGATRELDVARKDARKYRLDARPIKRLRKRRRRKAHRLLRACAHPSALRRRMRGQLRALRRRGRVPVASAAARLRARLGHVRGSDLHHLRMEARKARYVLEACGESMPSLERLQNSAGRAHDLEVLSQLVDNPAPLRGDLRRFSREARAQAPAALEDARRVLGLHLRARKERE